MSLVWCFLSLPESMRHSAGPATHPQRGCAGYARFMAGDVRRRGFSPTPPVGPFGCPKPLSPVRRDPGGKPLTADRVSSGHSRGSDAQAHYVASLERTPAFHRPRISALPEPRSPVALPFFDGCRLRAGPRLPACGSQPPAKLRFYSEGVVVPIRARERPTINFDEK
jgi:hypothetical protein